MYYIFNKDGDLLGTCNFEPNLEDLETREEYCVESSNCLNISRIVGGKYGGIYESVETIEEAVQKETDKLLQQRNKLLNNTDWITTRHFEEKISGKETTLSDSQISEFLIYRQTIRDITSSEGFPFVVLPQQPQVLE